MKQVEEPPLSPDFVRQAELICASYMGLLGKRLVALERQGPDLARAIWEAPFVVVSHDTSADPLFNFANRKALELWEMPLSEFIGLPSRKSAEPEHRDERAVLLQSVAEKGYFSEYRGVRASKRGRRFLIEGATVFNLRRADGELQGQAATFQKWTYL